MTDRELLELAAKAGGIDLLDWRDQWADYSGPAWRTTERELWNPLTDDGDALRLAIKLRMAVDVNVCFVDVAWCNYVLSEMYDLQEDWGDGDVGCEVKIAATRRAIVRAAAEIGRAMP